MSFTRAMKSSTRRAKRGVSKAIAGVLSALMIGTVLVATGGGLAPAAAAEGASIYLVKHVMKMGGAWGKEARDLLPGDTVRYRVEFRVNDEDADAPARVRDVLPAEFAGWQISDLTAVVGGKVADVTLDLPDVTTGASPATPVSGTIGSTTEGRTITVGVEQTVQAGAGNDSGLGMTTQHSGVLEYTLQIPSNLSPTDPILRKDLVNTATFTAKSGEKDLSVADTALITVDNKIVVDVTPSKTWAPAEQGFQPGALSTITIGATQASNVDASSLSLQDPADAALAPAGATELPADNPFNFVDFAGFTVPTDPTANLPAGASSATVEVYHLSGGTWNWGTWNASIANDTIAGVRTNYEGVIPPGAAVSQGFTVEQRATNRASDKSISAGYAANNEVRATVTVPGQDPVSKNAEAPFTVTPEQIDVTATKHFYTPPAGAESTKLTDITVGDNVGVVLRGINKNVPESTVLDSLTIAEPVSGSNELFFGTKLVFDGFNNSDPAKAWPAEATAATLTWTYSDDSTVEVPLVAPAPLPAPATGKTVTGFEITFTGAIVPGAVSEIRYELASSTSDDFVAPGKQTENLKNIIEVTGEKVNLPKDSAKAEATVAYVAPRIDVKIDKSVGPSIVRPGQDVVVQLATEVKTSGGRTQPTEIIVEDVLGAPGTFWDAFNATEILPPITLPTGASNSTLVIKYQTSPGVWAVLATNPAEDKAIEVPAEATGLKFEYRNAQGFSKTSYVKPNILFTARDSLRSNPAVKTGTNFPEINIYENVATATSKGKLDDRVVTGDATDKEDVGIRGQATGTPGDGTGADGFWVDKDWAHSTLESQSAAKTWTTQSWAVTKGGFKTVELQDVAVPTSSGKGTVYEAFNLTHIRPINFSGLAGNGTKDPQLRWDIVTAVELFNGSDWIAVPAPDGSWMSDSGFKGYTLTGDQQKSTVSVRLTITENTAARNAAHDGDNPNLTAPKAGTGVAASAEIRQFRLDWQLREIARADQANDPVKWVKNAETTFNCEGLDGADKPNGCIDNVFGITGTEADDSKVTATANDTILLIDGVMNVSLTKQVQKIGDGKPPVAPGAEIGLVVPNPGELAQSDYPRARFTLTAKNSSTGAEKAHGKMKTAKIRVTDTANTIEGSTAPNMEDNPFVGRDFGKEVASQDGNHFDEFTLTGVSFGDMPSYINRDQSSVVLWMFDKNNPAGTTKTYTLQQAIDKNEDFVADLANAIGVAAIYSGTDPETNGNQIPVGVDLVMYLDVQLRANERLSGNPVKGGALDKVIDVPNVAVARGWDAVVNPKHQPTSSDTAKVSLSQALIDVKLAKTLSVTHDGVPGKTIYETDPAAPVSVLLTATPGASTAPLNTLRIEDKTPSFWERFEFVSVGTATHPTDADRATYEVLVDKVWVNLDTYVAAEGDLAKILGVAVKFDRVDEKLFPLGATSWNASWDKATLPFTVQLRANAAIDWTGDTQDNTATTLANNTKFGDATAEDSKAVNFSPGVHKLRVEKRAPNDTSTHEVEALTSMPWKLEFTNIGTSYLPLTHVTDVMPASLNWDGEEPVITSTPVSGGSSGVTAAPTVTLSEDSRNLVFEWPAGTRMQPGEKVEISLGMVMEPLGSADRALNEVIVETGVDLALCDQPKRFGQAPNIPGEANQCSNTNYVQPRVGTVVGVRKTVSGEHVDTLGEDLVNGALNVRTLEDCTAAEHFPAGSKYTRNPCASYTAVGAVDTWKLENINSGTNPLARMTVVDMMPTIGDQMLSGGAQRGSTFEPVLLDPMNIRLSGLPEGATFTVDVTVNAEACVGSTPGSSLWMADPTCENIDTNPANVWTALADYEGAASDIAGLRFNIDMAAKPLSPGGNVIIEFETVNRVVNASGEALKPTLEQFKERQFAWNQNGAVAWDESDVRVNIPASPQRAGVTVKTGSLVVSKQLTGPSTDRAPEAFEVELSCTVPSGVLDPELELEPVRVALDLGDQAVLTVPGNGSVTVDGLPIGADCQAQEKGKLGLYEETSRKFLESPGVTPSEDGLTADVKIREFADGAQIDLQLVNNYEPIKPPSGSPFDPDGALSITGSGGGGIIALAAAILLALGAGAVVAAKRRSREGTRDTLAS